MERSRDFTGRLAWQEEIKALPWGAVWDYYCLKCDVPVGKLWLDSVRNYEKTVLTVRM
jgi:L-rhamnose isomerase